MNFITTDIIIFFTLSLINVMLSTFKSILTVKAKNKLVASLINAITFGFYMIVLKKLTIVDLKTAFIVTVLTNLIGVYLSIWILDLFKKDKLWKIEVTTSNGNIVDELADRGIKFTYQVGFNSNSSEYYMIQIYSYSQAESQKAKDILNKYDVKYLVLEVNNAL